jgi:hypothetical protein
MIRGAKDESVDSDSPARTGKNGPAQRAATGEDEAPPSELTEEEMDSSQQRDLERWEWEGGG